MLLNKEAYVMEKDKLIYDAKHPVDAKIAAVSITTEEEGVLRRGQLLDTKDGTYSIHAQGGEAGAIAAEDTEYAAGDTEISVSVYISGSFRKSEVISDPDITETDVENLRGKGIYLK